MDFVNRTTREIRDEFPKVPIHTFAYNFTVEPPKNVLPVENVLIQLCVPLEECYRHPLAECTESHNSTPGNVSFTGLLSAWAEISDNLAVWDYTTDYYHYHLPYLNFEALQANIRYFADNNVKFAFIQGNCNEVGEFGELRTYLVSKLLWNPNMTEEEYWALADEFLMNYYGPGGEKIREYIQLLLDVTDDIHMVCNVEPEALYNLFSHQAQVIRDDSTYPEELTKEMIMNYETTDWTPYWNYYHIHTDGVIHLLSEGRRLFEEALNMAETDEQRTHIGQSSIQLDYLESYIILCQIDAGKDDIYTMIMNFCDVNPDTFTHSEKAAAIKGLTHF